MHTDILLPNSFCCLHHLKPVISVRQEHSSGLILIQPCNQQGTVIFCFQLEKFHESSPIGLSPTCVPRLISVTKKAEDVIDPSLAPCPILGVGWCNWQTSLGPYLECERNSSRGQRSCLGVQRNNSTPYV